jgi:Uncharacterized protein conserved in bacteria
MDKFIGYAFLAVLIFYVYKRFLKRSPSQSQQPRQTSTKLPTIEQSLVEQPFPAKISFEEQWRTGPLHCDGVACNPKDSCSDPERWLCRDVISKTVPAGHFSGQFRLALPSGLRRIDFAIETLEGRRIAVELDGYNAHVENLTRSDFDEQLSRQNELTCAGWTVLRFSFDQLRKNAELCRSTLHSAMNYRGEKFNKTPVLKGHCPNSECDGQARRLRSKSGDFFWKCSKCKKTFNSDAVIPGLWHGAEQAVVSPAAISAQQNDEPLEGTGTSEIPRMSDAGHER